MKGLPSLFLAAALTLAVPELRAQEFPAPILKIEREEVKFDKVYEHIKTEIPFVREAEKRRGASHWLTLSAYTGRDEVWALIGESSFAALEADERKIADDPAALAENIRLHEADNQLLRGTSTILAVFREDMSYRPKTDWPHMRYMFIRTYRVRPGYETKFEQSFKMYNDAHVKGNIDEHMVTYQTVFGGEPIYLQLYPLRDLGEIDQIPGKHEKRYEDALGKDGQEKIDALQSEALASEGTQLFSISPEMSFVPEEWKKTDPGFWATPASAEVQPFAKTAQNASNSARASSLPAASGPKLPPDSFFVTKEKELWEVLVQKDRQTAERLLGEDFVGMYQDGFATKADWVKQIGGKYTLGDYHWQDLRVIPLGSRDVLLLYKARCKGSGEWTDFCSRPEYISSLWEERNGRWVDVFSQDTASVDPQDDDKAVLAAILRSENQIVGTLQRNDIAAFAKMLPDDVMDISTDGMHEKAEWVESFAQQKKSGFLFQDFKFEDPKLIRLGPDAALFTAKEIIHVVDKGKLDEEHLYTLACYVRRNGKWVPRFYQDTTAKDSH